MNYAANSQRDVKRKNQEIIIDLLREQGPTSRASISKIIGASKPTVSKNVDDLICKKLVLEVGKDDNAIGKKAMLLSFNHDYGYVLSLDLSGSSLKAEVSNLGFEQVMFYEKDFDDIQTIETEINQLFQAMPVQSKEILQCIISYPGVVGHNGSYYLSNVKKKEQWLKELIKSLKKKLSGPIEIRNDVNLATLAQYNATLETSGNMFYLHLDRGVGSGIIINGDLYEGDRNAAGEIGFILPTVGETGYKTLEEVISYPALLASYKEETGESISFKELVTKQKNQDPVVGRLYDQVVSFVSVAVSNVTSILDIQQVVLNGRLLQLDGNLLQDIQTKVNEISPLETQLKKASGDYLAIKGSTLVGVEKIIENLL